ncbi:MAG: adenylate kinase [Chlorobi bacterium]|nr:adenylate kinase [Chlorobiota bacterium]
MKQLILITGAPGSGKTSTAKKAVEKLGNINHYSMGEIFREEVNMKTKTGKKIEIFLNKGITVPIQIAQKAIKNVINNSKNNNIIIDGFPRDEEQLRFFNIFIKNQDTINLKGLIEIKVDKKNAKARILNRKGRTDDNENIFEDRMMYYLKFRNVITETYKKL